jgi:hypothetical protein
VADTLLCSFAFVRSAQPAIAGQGYVKRLRWNPVVVVESRVHRLHGALIVQHIYHTAEAWQPMPCLRASAQQRDVHQPNGSQIYAKLGYGCTVVLSCA